MGFSKRFPRQVPGQAYPEWEEIYLTEPEEEFIEQQARKENLRLMDECIEDAKKIIARKNLKTYQTDLINMAISLFEKRASHTVYWKEEKAKEKFDKLFPK